MKKIILSFLVSIFVLAANAQIENPVKWTYTAKKIGPGKYELHMTAVLEGKWHIYAQQAGDGPVATEFTFDKNPLVKTDGKVAELGKMVKEYDNNFKSTLKFYGNKVDFVQKVNVKGNAMTVAKGKVTYMVCNDQKCLPPKDVAFVIKIDPKA
jgi:hypothetical protein